MKILFITANRVGDAVLTTGLLSWMVDTYPEAHFTIACGPYGADLFRAVPRLERLIIMRKKKANGHWLALWRQCLSVKWDLIVDMRNSVVSRLLRAKRRVYYQRRNGQHKVVENAAVLAITPPPPPHIWLSDEALRVAEQLVPTNRMCLALGPAANWPPKQWPIAHFIDLVTKLTGPGGLMSAAPVMIVADLHERDQIEPLLSSIPHERRIEMIGYDLQTVAACLRRARLFIGNDSGLMHLSAALSTPTLGMFGPGFPLIYGPWGDGCAYITTPETRDELVARLPNLSARSPNLMESLTVARVFDAACLLLERT